MTRSHQPTDSRASFERRAWLTHELPVITCLALIWVLSNQPSLPGPGERGSLIRDIFNYGSHAAIYGVLGILIWRVLTFRTAALPRALTAHPRVSAALLALTWGITDEWHQSYIPGRTASPWDALTDLAGASLALYFMPLLLRLWQERVTKARPGTPGASGVAHDE